MATIINQRDQRFIINLIGRRKLELSARTTANISEEELSSPQLKSLIANGDITVLFTGQDGKGKMEPSGMSVAKKAEHDMEIGKENAEINKAVTSKTDETNTDTTKINENRVDTNKTTGSRKAGAKK